jgi:hypothetical protein
MAKSAQTPDTPEQEQQEQDQTRQAEVDGILQIHIVDGDPVVATHRVEG